MESSKLETLRKHMSELKLDGLIISHQDAHGSEYLASCDERIEFISHFGGSNGICFVTESDAWLWTDSRYYLAAQKQLAPGWKMNKIEQGQPTWQEFLGTHCPEKTIGYNSRLISINSLENLQKQLLGKNVTLQELKDDLVDLVWKESGLQPALPSNPVKELDLTYTGQSVPLKLQRIREEMEKKKTNALVVSKLDDICWSLNLRGSDIQFNPVFFSYMWITAREVVLFSTQSHNQILRTYCQEYNITLEPYDQFYPYLQKVKLAEKENVWISRNHCNGQMWTILKSQNECQLGESIIEHLKAIKNPTELLGLVNSHKRDGAALALGFSHLEQLLLNNDKQITEYEFAMYLDDLRRQQPLSQDISFETISSSGPNAAIVHYKPEKDTSAVISRDQIFLCDSGGQYLDGTTDVTRTFHWGEDVDPEIKDRYTRVLLGNLDLERVRWPARRNIGGAQLDLLARQRLWQIGLDYGHGTGHGVGHFLNVHEGPQGISLFSYTPLQAGMIVTDEPGFYKQACYGIRIENELVIQLSSDYDFLQFFNLTLSPYDRNLIDFDMLTEKDTQYIDLYHQRVFKEIAPLLSQDTPQYKMALAWLKKRCEPLSQY